MKTIQANKPELQRALQTVSKIVNPKSVIPIFSNVLLEVNSEGAVISGTNLEIGMRYTLQNISGDEFKTAIPAKLITDLVTNIQGEKISLKYDEEKKSMLISTKNNKNTLNCMDASDFTEIQTIGKKSITLNSTEFKKIINRVSFASEPDGVGINPVLNCVLITVDEGKLVFFATDGFHLSYEEVAIKKPIELHAIVRASVLETIAKVIPDDEQMKISVSDNQFRVSCGSIEISAQKTEGKYPDYKMFSAGKPNTRISISTAAMFNSCKQLELFGSQGIKIETAGMMLNLSASSKQLGNSDIQLVAKIEGEITLGINVVYLKEFLSIVHTDEIVISMENNKSPILFTMKDFPSYYHIIMPYSLENL